MHRLIYHNRGGKFAKGGPPKKGSHGSHVNHNIEGKSRKTGWGHPKLSNFNHLDAHSRLLHHAQSSKRQGPYDPRFASAKRESARVDRSTALQKINKATILVWSLE